jgi:hypothetical protein
MFEEIDAYLSRRVEEDKIEGLEFAEQWLTKVGLDVRDFVKYGDDLINQMIIDRPFSEAMRTIFGVAFMTGYTYAKREELGIE